MNTFAVFAELGRELIRKEGYFGCILPLGIATDETTKEFFRDVVERKSLVAVLGFINERLLFAEVMHNFKFCILVLTGGVQSLAPRLVFNCHDVEETNDPLRWFSLTGEQIKLLNPETATCSTFLLRRSAEVTLAIYGRLPLIMSEANGWNPEFFAMLHMGEASALFSTTPTAGSLPVFESKMIHQFNHRFASYHLLGAGERSHMLPELPSDLRQDPAFSPTPCYYCAESEVATKLAGRTTKKWLIASRRISNPGLARTCIYAIIPFVGASDSLTIAFLPHASARKHAVFVSCMNSVPFDFVTRQKQAGVNVSCFVIRQLPIVPAEHFDKTAPWDARDTIGEWVFRRALELTYTAWDLEAFAQDCGWSGPPFRWDEERRFQLRCELDAAFFHLYGLNRDDTAYILDTFPIVKRKDEEKHGHYRTKDRILALYEQFAEASTSGQAFVSPLNPPPGDLGACHPPRASA